MQSSLQIEPLFLITYVQDGLLRRDSYHEQAESAQRHCDYLQGLFPDAQVQLHEILFSSGASSSGSSALSGFASLDF